MTSLLGFWTEFVFPSRWSLLLVAAGLLGQWLVGEKRILGWAVGIGTQGLWIAYAVTTHQYGFLLSAAAFTLIYGRNWRRWRREAQAGRRATELERGCAA